MINRDVALYIHIPFCRHICTYCDFCHRMYNREMALKWFDEFKNEFNSRVNFYPKTIYLGGGTPTSLGLDIFEELLKLIDAVSKDCHEYTIEINPETFDEKKALLLNKYHINRASIGLESSNGDELKILGRHHDLEDVKRTVSYLKDISKIDNYSLDLLYSFPTQTLDSFKQSIFDAFDLKPKHLSLYSLTVEENTVFGKKGVKSFDEDREADFYELAYKIFEDNGYHQYEVSNFCLDGYESKHNLAYWHYDDFIGISLGASSKINHQRIDNTRDFNKYLNHDYYEEIIDLSKEDEMFEMIMMGLRLNKGLDMNLFKDKFDIDISDYYKDVIDKHLKLNNLKIINQHLVCANLEILNTILVDFL